MTARRQLNPNSESVDNYLKAILVLGGSQENRVTGNALARRLGVAPASVTNMLQKLAVGSPPLVEYQRHHGVLLSSAWPRLPRERGALTTGDSSGVGGGVLAAGAGAWMVASNCSTSASRATDARESHCWAAFRIRFSHVAAEPNLALKVANRLLACPSRFVPSGTKLMVISWGLGQALPLVV